MVGGMKKSQVKFDKTALKEQLEEVLVQRQTENFILYAISELTRMQMTHEFTNRTFNLEDSYVWAVYYNGKVVPDGYGFAHSQKATKENEGLSGREQAEHFVSRYKPTQKSGWEVVWAATMPYATKLEKGESPRKRNFYVLSQRYDAISRELGPKCDVELYL